MALTLQLVELKLRLLDLIGALLDHFVQGLFQFTQRFGIADSYVVIGQGKLPAGKSLTVTGSVCAKEHPAVFFEICQVSGCWQQDYSCSWPAGSILTDMIRIRPESE